MLDGRETVVDDLVLHVEPFLFVEAAVVLVLGHLVVGLQALTLGIVGQLQLLYAPSAHGCELTAETHAG